MSTLYSALPIVKGQLRLLRIKRIEPQIVCELEVCEHEKVEGSYFALSYEWGNTIADETIVVNGFELQAMSNLKAALYTLYRDVLQAPETKCIWIDAICLDQENPDEIKDQLPLMGRIYFEAKEVLGYMGPGTEDSIGAMRKINALLEPYKNFPELVYEEYLHAVNLPEIGNEFWRKVRGILQRAYFRRLWIWQEIVLAKTLLLISGPVSFSWNDFDMFIDIVRKRNMLNRIQDANELASRDSILFSLTRIKYYRAQFHNSDGFKGVHMPSLLHTFRYREVKEPVDRVWGSMALWSPDLAAKASRLGWIKVEDKDKERYWETYILTGKYFITREPTLAWLSLTSYTNKNERIPSWCPDWNTKPAYESFAGIRWFTTGFHNLDECRSDITLVPDSNAIEVPGVLVDRVRTVTEGAWFYSDIRAELPAATAKFLDWEEECLKLSQATYSCGDDVPPEHARTLVSECLDDRGFQVQHDVRPMYHRLIEQYQKVSKGTDVPYDGYVQRYSKAIQAACQGRKYFSTTGGRVGLGPPGIKKGDSVVAFDSALPLFILRESNEQVGKRNQEDYNELRSPESSFTRAKQQESYELIGDAYVCGLMTKSEVERHRLDHPRRFKLV